MAAVTFASAGDRRFPEDVQQCSECLALVLTSNAPGHADWHDRLADDALRIAREAIADHIAGRKPRRPQPQRDRRLSMPPEDDPRRRG